MVVSNSGPLIALGKLGFLDILGHLYEKVKIPRAVYDEVVSGGRAGGYADSLQVELALQRNFLEVMKVKNSTTRIASLPLDNGEKEVLDLALENQAELLLMDDMLAREQAKRLGMIVKGTLGVIVTAYRQEFFSLDELRIIFDTIIKRNDIWIAEGLCRSVLDRLTNSNND